jgi:hypothetical protein
LTNYEVTESDIDASLEYLGKIYSYSTKKQYDARGINPVLIGGWAVHAYNPWFGSLDIALCMIQTLYGLIMGKLPRNKITCF